MGKVSGTVWKQFLCQTLRRTFLSAALTLKLLREVLTTASGTCGCLADGPSRAIAQKKQQSKGKICYQVAQQPAMPMLVFSSVAAAASSAAAQCFRALQQPVALLPSVFECWSRPAMLLHSVSQRWRSRQAM